MPETIDDLTEGTLNVKKMKKVEGQLVVLSDVTIDLRAEDDERRAYLKILLNDPESVVGEQLRLGGDAHSSTVEHVKGESAYQRAFVTAGKSAYQFTYKPPRPEAP